MNEASGANAGEAGAKTVVAGVVVANTKLISILHLNSLKDFLLAIKFIATHNYFFSPFL